jgi:alkanesulfonate monooxygenase SsuD/methylene tetrahydromethanopterin reductase-like flavin-dependent oxidoreductase (luciferase family)
VTLSEVPQAFPVIGQAVVGVADDGADLGAVRAAIRSLVAFYASTPAYRRVLDVHGWGPLQTELRELTRAGRWAELPAAVPDEVVDTIALVGSPAEVAAGLKARFARCERVALSTPYPVSAQVLAELVDLTR